MNKIAPFFITLMFVSAIIQINFLLNSELINGQYLTFIGVLVGLCFALLFNIFRRRQFVKHMNIIYDRRKAPWYINPPNHLLEAFFSIFAGTLFVTLLNNLPDTGDIRQEPFTVKYTSEQLVQYDSVPYAMLESGDQEIKYILKKGESYTKGQEVIVTLERGLLGFSRLASCKPKSS